MLFYRPHIYLTSLLINASTMGLVVALIYTIFNYHTKTDHATIPVAFHNVIGVVLGLLLVFRTNTAYDRWWKARELFGDFEAKFVHLIGKIKNHETHKRLVKSLLLEATDHTEMCLVSRTTTNVHKKFYSVIYRLQQLNKDDQYKIDNLCGEILMTFTSLERIRDTPIPTSYSLHIKVSIYLYFLTMPFGLLYEMKYWSIPLTMILYYIVAGIEIISNEIENPFHGDPNDLPVRAYLDRLRNEINEEL